MPRSDESYESEQATRDMIIPFLTRCGFRNLDDQRVRRGQSIVATSPEGLRLTMRVRLCWEKLREPSKRAAAYLAGVIKGTDWESGLLEKFERENSEGVTHLLFVERFCDELRHVALIALSEVLPIWKAQRDEYERLIDQRRLGGIRQNPAINGSMPSIYLKYDRAPQIAAMLWNHRGVCDLTKLVRAK